MGVGGCEWVDGWGRGEVEGDVGQEASRVLGVEHSRGEAHPPRRDAHGLVHGHARHRDAVPDERAPHLERLWPKERQPDKREGGGEGGNVTVAGE